MTRTPKSGPAAEKPGADRPADDSPSLIDDLNEHPGHLFRRAQQISTSVFYANLGEHITPIQFALLNAIQHHPGVDQVTLASLVGLDTSTTAATATRLEEKGLIERRLEVVLRRQRKLYLTAQGVRVMEGMARGLTDMRTQLLSRLSPWEQETLMRLLRKFVEVNNEFSRAPLGEVSRLPKGKRNSA